MAARTADVIKVCVCGGGNAAHTLVGMLSHSGVTVNLFAPYADEAARWQANKDRGLLLHMPDGDVRGHVNHVSKYAEDVIPESDIVLLPIPAFAVPPTLQAIAGSLKQGAIVGAMPGSGGFHFAADQIIHKEHNRKDVVLFGTNQLPLNCRFNVYAEEATCLSVKKQVKLATVPRSQSQRVGAVMSSVLWPINFESLPHMIAVCLYPANQTIHPSRLYDVFKDWTPGKTWSEPPMFYAGFTEDTTKILSAISEELIEVAKQFDKHSPEHHTDIAPFVDHIHEAMKTYYGDIIEDHGAVLLHCFTKNYGYTGLKMPMHKLSDTEYEPDFKHRYFTEDIPNGLCLVKGVADILDMELPFITEIIEWAQGHMDKEYIVNGKLVGRDVKETGAPQKYGITTMEDLFYGVDH